MSDASPVRFIDVTPYLYYEDAAAAIEWLTRVFGFTEDVRYIDPDGLLAEAEIFAGDSKIMMAGGQEAPPDEGRGQLLIVYVDDVDAHYEHVRKAGVAAEPPEDKPYGARVYGVSDPWGYKWSFWQELDEMNLGPGWQEIKAQRS